MVTLRQSCNMCFHAIIQLLFTVYVAYVCIFTRFIFMTNHDNKKINKFKIQRIRFFTQCKLLFFENYPYCTELLGLKNYLRHLKKKLRK